MRVIFLLRPEIDGFPGGDESFAIGLAARLRKEGVEVDLWRRLDQAPSNYDIAHAFNLLCAQLTWPPLSSVVAAGIPIVFTPFYRDTDEENWYRDRLSEIYGRFSGELERELAVNSLLRARRNRTVLCDRPESAASTTFPH